MFNWIFKKLTKPLIPLLQQGYKVSTLVESGIREALTKLTPGTSTYEKLSTIYTAVILVSIVLKKTLIFLGGEVPTVNTASTNLYEEIEKLKKMI